MVREEGPRLAERGPDPRRSRSRAVLVGLVLAVLFGLVLVLLVVRPWTDGGAEPVEAPGVAPSAPLPER